MAISAPPAGVSRISSVRSVASSGRDLAAISTRRVLSAEMTVARRRTSA